jgi:hypothetical protein
MIKLTLDSYKVKDQLTEWHQHLGQSKQSFAFIGPLGGTVSWVHLEARTKLGGNVFTSVLGGSQKWGENWSGFSGRFSPRN